MDETNQNPSPITPTPAPSAPANNPKGMHKLVALVVGVLVLALAAGGTYYLKQHTAVEQQAVTPSPTPTQTPIPQEPVLSGDVAWHYPIEDGFLEILDSTNPDNLRAHSYLVGTFKKGKYSGKEIIRGNLECNCLGSGGTFTLVVNQAANPTFEKPYILIKNNSVSSIDAFDKNKVDLDAATKIEEIILPPTVNGPKPNQTVTDPYQSYYPNTNVNLPDYQIFNVTNLKFAFNDPKYGAVYTTPDDSSKVSIPYGSYAFYVKAPDYGLWIYQMEPNFIDKDYKTNITWNGGIQNTMQYGYTDRGGCGSRNLASVINNLNIGNDLVQTGITSKGDAVYELKDKNNPILKDIYDNQYSPYDSQLNKPGTKMPYDQFVAKHPVFFWVDPFGRLIKFAAFDFQPQAECAKPVIYLYPTQTENVSVKLAPAGGFKYSEPAYNSGWEVTATPDSKITVNGKAYPYLFWEGWGGLYETPDKGFVVAQSDVDSFLSGKLAELGLNAKESADFKEYWEPYLTGSPYYFITFMGNSVMNKIAPLTVEPKPDTVIRVLMDFKKLDKPIEIQGYDIKTPVRNGFTVVEWGGVKH
jgi:hypothetical protein